jgi:hypothetical protein
MPTTPANAVEVVYLNGVRFICRHFVFSGHCGHGGAVARGLQARSAWSFRGHQERPQSLLALFAGKVAFKIRINTTNRKQKVPGVVAIAQGLPRACPEYSKVLIVTLWLIR